VEPDRPSPALSPALRLLPPMHHRQHHKLISHYAKIDRERKSADNQTACLSMNAGMSERTCDDARHSVINGLRESLPKPSAL
ncbi:MAG TPA: hypothetical protein VEL48_07470, partial [Candidatus Acidoferrales bacterium]|nr:hypothetical protein [Candidatus Acidoferrales bacterium]